MEGKDGPEERSGISREICIRLSMLTKVGIMVDWVEEIDVKDMTLVCGELPESSSASSDTVRF